MNIDFEKNRIRMIELDQIANEYEDNGEEIIRMTLG